ncbi:helix-turn-helix domain-containing protein [Ktedonospora formicarum]|uniref:HTH cro/C1-type domain-containing protein n=1 Tax=Ktedonospora formicarum TaxID=2778364 RepID=A0A8J3MRH9_9CHLR|nr:helix-turn-helix domain-containing protein [Ktedonospora formicarum]GHO45070.1 hypothetical protein KSX_32330 [Ktedonospora formicarum]
MKKQVSWNTILRHERKVRGLSQNDVATVLDCDPKTVGRWERGEATPSPRHVQQLMRLFQKDAHQLGLLVGNDKITSASSLTDTHPQPSQVPEREVTLPTHVDWGDAPYIEHFYGRSSELAMAQHWVLEEHCRVVAFLGMGGSGKTTFARELAERLKGSFSYVYWYSLQNTPHWRNFSTVVCGVLG